MLFSTFTNKQKELTEMPKKLSQAEINLLTTIRSKGRFDQLMEVLPVDWEKTFEVNIFHNPDEVSRAFINEKRYRNSETIYENTVLSIIINKQSTLDTETGESYFKYPAVPARYDEYFKRDYDEPVEANKWKNNSDLTEFIPGSFHLDHKLIWVSKKRGINISSEGKIDNEPYKYSINIYIPSEETLIAVENLKRNGVL